MLLPFGEYRPDVSDYEGQTTRNILNVIPQGDGYGPFRGLTPYTGALPATCRGFFYALKNDGSVAVFAGTSTKLYMLNNTTNTWTDVSRGSGTYTTLSSTANWSFVQFNNFVIATEVNDVVQVYDLTSSTNFANLGGSPPQAAYASVVKSFLVLSGLASPNVYRVQWSGLNALTTWDNISLQSNFQDMADGGLVRGVAGGEYGVVFQDRSIRQMTYAPGSQVIFQFTRLSKDDGLMAPYSLVQAGDRIFYLSSAGFKMLLPGLLPTAIGKEKVDRTFFGDMDTGNLQLVIGAADPRVSRVYIAYKSQANGSAFCDKMLCYDWGLQKWTPISGLQMEYIATLAQPGMTLEQVDAAFDTGTSHGMTFTSASPGVFTATSHGLTAGQGLIFGGSAITASTNLSVNTPYYVLASGLTSNTFKIATTGGIGAWAGTAVNTGASAVGSTTATYIISNIDTLNIGTLDGISVGALPAIAGANSSHAIGFFTGSIADAVLETAEHGNGLRRIYVRGYMLISDATAAAGSVSGRERQGVAPTYTTERALNAQGFVPARLSTRYARGHVEISAGTNWTFATGVEPEIGEEGKR